VTAQTTVVYDVTDARHQAAQQLGLCPCLKSHLTPERSGQPLPHRCCLWAIQFERRCYLCGHNTSMLVYQVAENFRDQVQMVEPLLFRK